MLNIEIENELISHGANLVCFANIENLPANVTGGLPRAVSIAASLNPEIVQEISNGPTKKYFEEYKQVNGLLEELCERAVRILTNAGKQAEAIKATTEQFDFATLSTRLQHKTIATMAGMGWIGKSALLITKEYGPAVRLATVLTDAGVKAGKPVNESQCGQCRICVENCPAGAIVGKNWNLGVARESIYDAFACRQTASRLAQQEGIEATICGICINKCLWTQKYIKRELGIQKNLTGLSIMTITSGKNLEIVKELFVEYADTLGFDLDFQGFEHELANLAEHYAPPDGCLLLATLKGKPIGCVAMRKFGDNICEMKRLYIRPEFRGQGFGRALAEAVIKLAQKTSYNFMRLDTIPSMEAANKLYASLGFRDIESYRYNPIKGAVFMELKLT